MEGRKSYCCGPCCLGPDQVKDAIRGAGLAKRGPWVFPRQGTSGEHLPSLRHLWERVTARAKLPADIRLYDGSRHAFGTAAASHLAGYDRSGWWVGVPRRDAPSGSGLRRRGCAGRAAALPASSRPRSRRGATRSRRPRCARARSTRPLPVAARLRRRLLRRGRLGRCRCADQLVKELALPGDQALDEVERSVDQLLRVGRPGRRGNGLSRGGNGAANCL